MMELFINDPHGIKNGIQLDNIKCYSDPVLDQIRVYGTMSVINDIYAYQAEPEVCCNLMDKNNKVCYSVLGTHAGLFWISRYTSFRIELFDVSKYCNWDDIKKIELYLVFCNTKQNKHYEVV